MNPDEVIAELETIYERLVEIQNESYRPSPIFSELFDKQGRWEFGSALESSMMYLWTARNVLAHEEN